MKHKAKLLLRYFVLNELENVVEDNFLDRGGKLICNSKQGIYLQI